ncbi:MAG: LysR family transcriptional regulator [Bacteroidales bacterium]|nr:LysR family transcriptional regulator [Bacteroidales bacterium]
MDFELLREYLLISEEQSFSTAARKLHMSQSTLSKHVLALEEEFGDTLFERGRYGVSLTPAGMVLRQHARGMVSAYDETRQIIAAAKHQTSLRITGMLQNADIVSLLSCVAQKLQASNGGDMLLCPLPAVPYLESLARGDADIAICHEVTEDTYGSSEIECVPLYSNHFFAIVEPTHRYADRDNITLDELKDEPFVRLTGVYPQYGWDRIAAVCNNHGFEPKPYSMGAETIVDCLKMNLGDAVLILQKGLAPIESFFGNQRTCMAVDDEDAVFTVCMYYRREDAKKVKPFVDACLEEAQNFGMEAHEQAKATSRGYFNSRCATLAEKAGLNEEEQEAMHSFAKGYSIARIAEELELTNDATSNLLASVFRKVGVNDKQELLDKIEAVVLPW